MKAALSWLGLAVTLTACAGTESTIPSADRGVRWEGRLKFLSGIGSTLDRLVGALAVVCGIFG